MAECPAGGPTRGAGAAQVQGVVQLAHGVLQDALGLGGRAPQHLELLVQEPLLQPLLPRLLGEGRRQLGDPAQAQPHSSWAGPSPDPRWGGIGGQAQLHPKGWGPSRVCWTAQE